MRSAVVLALASCVCALGCGSSAKDVSVLVVPESVRVLTCSSHAFAATVIGEPSQSIDWSLSPGGAGSGMVDSAGQYTAPLATPATATVTLTAASHADATKTGMASITLATAFPDAPTTITGSTSGTAGVFPHSIAARGARVYSVWGGPASNQPSLMVSRSDDAGATWKSPVAAVTVTLAGGLSNSFGSNASCAAIAIDAGNPDVVYVYARMTDENDLGDAKVGEPRGGPTSFLAVSTDGAATFTTTVMQVGGTAGGPHGWNTPGTCGDVVSPAANTVVVESPGGYGSDGNPDIAIWADGARGAGFASGVALDDDYLANGYTDALDNLLGNHDIVVQQNGGTNDAGDATESPRLFTDGAGRVCITYNGVTTTSLGQAQSHVYVQCSDDGARTFSTPLVVDPAQPVDHAISSPVGAFGPNHAAAILWTNGITDGKLLIAISSDGGATFGAPAAIPTYALPAGAGQAPAQNPSVAYDAAGILWVAYVAYDGVTHERVIVDKSCDGGETWSGPVLVNGPESSITDMRFPAFAVTTAATPSLVATPANHLAYFTLTP